MITREHVLEAQKLGGDGVVKIGSLKQSRTECEVMLAIFLIIVMLLNKRCFIQAYEM